MPLSRRRVLLSAATAAATLALPSLRRGLIRPAAAQPARAGVAPQYVGPALPPPIDARAVALIDGDTGTVLLAKDAYSSLPPASLTKIVTAYVTLQRADPKLRIIAGFSKDELDPDGTTMGLDPGEELTIEDLLYGLMLPSGNDAALVLARAITGSEAAFVGLMNATLRAAGLRGSQMANPHGLDARNHLMSAHDLAQISRLAMQDQRFCRIVAAEAWTVRSQWTYTLYNRNTFVGSYRGADGVKIGWTEDAGLTIVASATRRNHRLILALLNTADRNADSAAMLDWAFANFRWPSDAPITDAPED